LARTDRFTWLSDRQRAGPFAIETEVLRHRTANQRLASTLTQSPQGSSIFSQAFGETLVSEVDQRQCPALVKQRADRSPLLRRKIDAGRVVAAAVQHHDVAGGDLS